MVKPYETGTIYFADWNPGSVESDVLPITKVGVSSDVNRRLAEISKMIPIGDLELVARFRSDNARTTEAYLHECFREQGWSVRGYGQEYFNLPNDVVNWAESIKHAKNPKDIESTEEFLIVQ